MYRAVLIGCGNIGSLYAEDPKIKGIYTHAAAYHSHQKTKLVAVCDLDIQKASKAANQWNCEYYNDYIKMLEEKKPDIVSICTPDNTHSRVLEAVLNTKNVSAIIIEKPLALDPIKAKQLVRIAKSQGVILIVNYCRRFSIEFLKIKEMIDLGYLGEIQKLSGYYTKGILHNGTHWLDLSTWFIGKLKNIQGFSIVSNNAEDPTLDAKLEFTNGAIGFLQGLKADHFSLFEMDIIGSKGRISIKDSGHRINIFDVQESPFYSGYNTLLIQNEIQSDLYDSVFNCVSDLVECLETKKPPNCSGEDGLYVLNIGLKIIESAKNNSIVLPIESNYDKSS